MLDFEKDIIDISIVNNQLIKTQKVNFDIENIENKISKIKYVGNNLIKDKEFERAKIPMIVKIFYEYIFLRKILTPKKLYCKYLNRYFKKQKNGKYKLVGTNQLYNKEGIKARIYRAYPSLLRDFHFYILCYNSGFFEKVEYSYLKDVNEGIDLFITYKGIEFAISLFVNTKRSLKYKKRKYKRHDYSDLNEICISINPFDKKNYVGNFALYRNYHIDYMIEKMNEIILSNNL